MGSPRGTGFPAHLTAKREEVPLSDPLRGDSFDARARVSSPHPLLLLSRERQAGLP